MTVDNKEVAMCAFLDIEGAFDNACSKVMLYKLPYLGEAWTLLQADGLSFC